MKTVLKKSLSLLLVLCMMAGMLPALSVEADAATNKHALRASSKIQVYSQWDASAYGGYDNNWINTSGCGWFTIGHMLQWLGIIPRDQESKNSVLYRDLYTNSGYITTNTNIAGAMRHTQNLYSNLRIEWGYRDLRTVLTNGGAAFIHKYGHYYAAVDISDDGQYVHIVDSCMCVPNNNGVAVYLYDAGSNSFYQTSYESCAVRSLNWYCGTGYVMKPTNYPKGIYAGGDYWVKYNEVASWVEYAFYRIHTHTYTNGVCTGCGDWDRSSWHVTADHSAAKPGKYVTVTKDSAALRSGPYQAVSKITVGKKTELTVLQAGYNAYGSSHVWYKVLYNGAEYYIYKDNVSSLKTKAEPSTLYIAPASTSYSITVGDSLSISASVSSNYLIKKITATIDGKSVTLCSDASAKSKVVTLATGKSTAMNMACSVAGTHTLSFTATDASGASYTTPAITVTIKEPVIPVCAVPTLTTQDIDGGKRVTISTATSGATVYATATGPASVRSISGTNSVVFDICENTTFSATVSKSGCVSSSFYNRSVSVLRVTEPGISYVDTVSGALVTIDCATTGAVVYYSTGEGYLQYTGPFTLAKDCSVTAYAKKPGCVTSSSVTESIRVSAPAAPSVMLSTTERKVPLGSSVLLSWSPISNAGSYTVTLYRNGDPISIFSGITTTSRAFILDTAGEYRFTVSAQNLFGSSDPATSTSITAVAPLTVRFIDWDGSLLSQQQVSYGSSAIAPADPSRIGHYFRTWDKDFSSVREDLEISPVYQVITYTVTYLDADGNRISTESVPYGGAATPPADRLTPPNESYSFAGWSISAESAGSDCDLGFVDSNMVAQAVFRWTNADLPVTITDVTASWDEETQLYSVSVDMRNYPEKFTTALLRVSLKTSDDKMVQTESRTVELEQGGTASETVTLNYSGIASVAEAVVLGYDGDYLTGSTYSEAASARITTVADYTYGSWSEWSTTPYEGSDIREVETKTQYRYRDKSFTTSNSSAMAGWVQYQSPTTSFTEWTDVGWVATKPSTSSTTRYTNTRVVTDAPAYTLYNYYHWYGYNSSGALYNSYGNTYWKNYESTSSTSPFPYYQTFDSYYPSYKASVSGKHGNIWWLESTTTVPAVTHTEYWKQTRTAYTTYYYSKWNNWSDWQDTLVSASDTRGVETRTLYRYRDKDVPVSGFMPSNEEDRSGEVYRFSGTLPVNGSVDLSGKLATVMVYKGKNADPNESQLQYVGQIGIEDGNVYDLTLKTKDAPSIDSGDYIVALSLEGTTGLINIDMIPAPVEAFTVTFYNSDGTVLKEEQVCYGGSVSAPESPSMPGYRFVTWDNTATNITSDLDIVAVYVPETYAVAFVDWLSRDIILYTCEYGTALKPLANTVAPRPTTGHTFSGWTLEDGSALTEETIVSANTVVVANFNTETYAVNFRNQDGSILCTRTVSHGECADLPEDPTCKDMIFLGWSTDSTWWNVTEDMDVYPLFVYTDTATAPFSPTGSAFSGEAATVTLMAAENATVFYTLDGSVPNELSEQYTGPITLTESACLRAVAVEAGKNHSDVLEVFFEPGNDYESEEDADAVSIGSYRVNVSPGEQVPLNLLIDSNPGLMAYLFYIECDRSVFYLDVDDNGAYLCNSGSASEHGTMFVSDYGTSGYQVLWFSPEASHADGSLFDLVLNTSEEAEEGSYEIKVSFSPANTVSESDIAADADSMQVVFSDSTLVGDVNGDGILSTVDVVRIARFLIDDIVLSEDQLKAADVTGDGAISAADVIRLARHLVGLAELNG